MRPHSASTLLRGPPQTLVDIIKMGFLQQVRELVDIGLNINCRDPEGKTPLMLCALVEPESWGVGIARHLIENGASLSPRDRVGLNALHHSCIYERLELAKVFLSAIDFDLNQPDKFGNTALHYAVLSGNVEVVKLIVEYLRRYKQTLETQNKEGLTPLDLALRKGIYLTVMILEGDDKPDSEEEDEDVENVCDVDEKRYSIDKCDARLTERNLKPLDELPEELVARPQTALLKRRRESSSSSSSTVSSGGRTQSEISVPCRPRQKTMKQTPRANEKNLANIIKCASVSDVRNCKEFVFKMTALPYDELDTERSLPPLRRPHSAWSPRRREEPFSWRTEFKKLYVDYEFQCSLSWRDSAKTISDQISESPAFTQEDLDEEKVKDRRGRRASITQKPNLNVESLKDRRRPSANARLRRISKDFTPHVKNHSSLLDGTSASSSESLSSSTSSKKKDHMKPDFFASRGSPPSSEKDTLVRGGQTSLAIPAVTETLVEDVDNAAEDDDVQPTDSNRLTVLSDIDED